MNLNTEMFSNALISLAIAGGAGLLGLVLQFLISFLLKRWNRQLTFSVRGMVLQLDVLRAPLRLLIPGICIRLSLVTMPVSESAHSFLQHILSIWIILAFAWLSIRLVHLLRIFVLSRYNIDIKDNLKARQAATQFKLIERILSITIIVIALAMILMTFEQVQQIGYSILASAGIIGVIVGFAAQKSLSTLVAGVQIAITQPIRLDDVVIVENEWGRIEEITLTYVVVKIWDLRRLIVPTTYFFEKPFQNWTRTSASAGLPGFVKARGARCCRWWP